MSTTLLKRMGVFALCVSAAVGCRGSLNPTYATPCIGREATTSTCVAGLDLWLTSMGWVLSSAPTTTFSDQICHYDFWRSQPYEHARSCEGAHSPYEIPAPMPLMRVSFQTPHGPITGWLGLPRPGTPLRLTVVLTGLAQPAYSGLPERLAHHVREYGSGVLIVERPKEDLVHLDPIRTAHRLAAVVSQLRNACGLQGEVGYIGVSLGGAEAILAASTNGGRSASIDAPMDFWEVAESLDRRTGWPLYMVMLEYFQLIKDSAFGPNAPSFTEILEQNRDGLTDWTRDAPAKAACRGGHHLVILSESDPLLGDQALPVCQRVQGKQLDEESHVGVVITRPHLLLDVARFGACLQ